MPPDSGNTDTSFGLGTVVFEDHAVAIKLLNLAFGVGDVPPRNLQVLDDETCAGANAKDEFSSCRGLHEKSCDFKMTNNTV